MENVIGFENGLLCLRGKLVWGTLYVDLADGCIIDEPPARPHVVHDMKGQIIAPAFLELQTNGCIGFHFTHFHDPEVYQENLKEVARYLVTTGVGSFWATLPTISVDLFKIILPHLKPLEFPGGADLLGAHCEDAALMQSPESMSAENVYGTSNLTTSIKMVTIAPELVASSKIIRQLAESRGICVSLGHSAADYPTGVAALEAGAKTLTHVFNAMNPLDHRKPGLAGLVASPEAPYYSIIADGIHLHPATVAMAFRANAEKCTLITDSIEMAGMPDGVYPGHAQIPHPQRKVGNKVTIEGTDTLIGSCISLDECVRNLGKYSGCSLAESVRCVTENIANLMGLEDRGVLEPGRRADLVILDGEGFVQQTWVRGVRVHARAHP
ncbi:MAG: hypothetical protein Q9187_000044 [Circinaria calcarea]